MEDRDGVFLTLVLRKGWENTAWALGSKRLDFGVTAVCLLIGTPAYWRCFGWPATVEQVVPLMFFTLGPPIVLAAFVSLWCFSVAPSAVLFSQLAKQERAGGVRPKPNYAIWNKRQSYSIHELAALLDDVDPAEQTRTVNQSAYQSLLLEHARSGKLAFLGHAVANAKPSTDSEIARSTAMAWMKRNGFDVTNMSD